MQSESKSKKTSTRHGAYLWVLKSGCWTWQSGLPPLYAPSSAAKRGSARRVFERSEFAYRPRFVSSAGCPQRSVGTQTVGSPFLCLLSFGEAKESKCAVGRTSRQKRTVGARPDNLPVNRLDHVRRL